MSLHRLERYCHLAQYRHFSYTSRQRTSSYRAVISCCTAALSLSSLTSGM